MKIFTDYSLRPLHTFDMEVCAARYAEYASVDELCSLLHELRTRYAGEPWLHIGGGSNLLFLSSRYEGTVLHSAIKGRQVVARNETCVDLRVGAGEVWDDLVSYTVSQGWSGMENLSLIPGEVGASAVQNIGAYGIEAKDLIVQVDTIEVATGSVRVFRCEECAYAYRDSVFKRNLRGQYIVTHVTYRLQTVPQLHLEYGGIRRKLQDMNVQPTPETVRRAVMEIRREKLPDPARLGNAGSFFVNPIVGRNQFLELQATYPDMPFYEVDAERVKIPAGWLIEQSGWKGRSMGRAAVYERQALVLVNLGGATGAEVLALSDAVCRAVLEKFNITISPEVNIIR